MAQEDASQIHLEADFISSVEKEPVGYCTFSVGEKILVRHISDEFCGFLGCSREEALALIDGDFLDLVHPDDRDHMHKAIDAAAHTMAGRTVVCRFVPRHTKNACGAHWARLSFIRTGSDAGMPVCSAVVTDITPEMTENEELWRQARIDALTGLMNRTAFIDATKEKLASDPSGPYVLGITDINRFKALNELRGVSEGDRVLKEFAAGLRKHLPAGSVLARLEADHFAFCAQSDSFDPDELVQFSDVLLTKIEPSHRTVVYLGFYPIDDLAVSVNTMCDRANMALDSIKGNHQQRFAYYDEKLRSSMLVEQQIVGDMDEALKNGEFKIHLQPVINASTEEIVSAEALVRWYRPDGTIVSPGAFIPVFERNGFVVSLDHYVWELACKYLRRQLDAGAEVVPVSVNISRVTLPDPDLCDSISRLVDSYGLDHSLVHFEITESAYTENKEQLVAVFNELRRRGFILLMDDFGSGYSSLNILRNLPVDIIKIDRGFILDIEDTERGGSVLGSVMRLAQRLGTSTIAEGVETEEQFKYLRGIGCESIQGYYFSKPLPEDEFAEFTRQNKSKIHKEADTDVLTTIVGISTNSDKKIVLIVDDNAINRMVLKASIDSRYYDVIEAENGLEALEKLRIEREDGLPAADIVLLDIVMPVMNGFDFLEHARKDPALATLPVIVLTSDETYENEIMALDAGADDYLKKPYNTTIINLKIKKLLDMRDLTVVNSTISSLVNSIPSGVAIIEMGDDERILYISDTLAAMSGLSVAEFMKRYEHCFSNHIGEEFRANVRKAFKDAAENGGIAEAVYRLDEEAGSGQGDTGWSAVWHKIRIRFVRWETGMAVYYADITDISMQHETEQQLEAQIERYRLLLEVTDAITFDYDVAGDVLDYDINVSGEQPSHHRIEHYTEYLANTEFVRKDHLDAYRQICKEAVKVPMRSSIEYPFLSSQDGEYHWGRAYYRSLGDESGMVYRVVGRVDDMGKAVDAEGADDSCEAGDCRPETGLGGPDD